MITPNTDYPLFCLVCILKYIRFYQIKHSLQVNHFPGTGFITNKVSLATSENPYIPKAFKIPKQKDQLLSFVSVNVNVLQFVFTLAILDDWHYFAKIVETEINLIFSYMYSMELINDHIENVFLILL